MIGQHGSWNRSTLSGYKVIFVPFANGRPAGPPRDILTGFLAPDERTSYGRPVGRGARPRRLAPGGGRCRRRDLARDGRTTRLRPASAKAMSAGAAMWSRLFALALLLLPAPALAGVKETIAALAPSGLVLVVDALGDELVAQNADEPFVPASVAKIVTAWLAMEVLGGDYRFETRFYLDNKRVLYVRGGGDPFLTSEELAPLAPIWSQKSARRRSWASWLTEATTLRTSASRASRMTTRPTMR